MCMHACIYAHKFSEWIFVQIYPPRPSPCPPLPPPQTHTLTHTPGWSMPKIGCMKCFSYSCAVNVYVSTHIYTYTHTQTIHRSEYKSFVLQKFCMNISILLFSCISKCKFVCAHACMHTHYKYVSSPPRH